MKTIRIAKQWGLEKMGRAEVVSESNTVRLLSEKCEDTRVFLKEVHKRVDKQCKAIQESVDEGKAVASAFANYSARMNQAYDQRDLGTMMNQLTQVQNVVESFKESLTGKLLSGVSAQLDALVKSDLAEAVNSKAKYDKVRRQYDASLAKRRSTENKLKPGGKGLAEEDKELADVKKELERVTEEVTTTLEVINKKAEFFVYERFSAMFMCYEDFFTRGNSFINNMKADFVRYQQSAEQARKEYEELCSRERTYVPSGLCLSPRTADPTKRIFGVPLADLAARDGTPLPHIIQRAIEHVMRPEVIRLEGIFRISGHVDVVSMLQSDIDSGKDVDFTSTKDPHCVAALIKLWLRLLPESIFPVSALGSFIALGKPEGVPEEEQIRTLRPAVDGLPELNKTVLNHMVSLCHEITKRQEENRMTASNLSTVLGPNLFFNESVDPRDMIHAMNHSNAALTLMIKNYPTFFPISPNLSSSTSSTTTASAVTSSPSASSSVPAILTTSSSCSFLGSASHSPPTSPTAARPAALPSLRPIKETWSPVAAEFEAAVAQGSPRKPPRVVPPSSSLGGFGVGSGSTPARPSSGGSTPRPSPPSPLMSGSGETFLNTTATSKATPSTAALDEGPAIVSGHLVASVTALICDLGPNVQAEKLNEDLMLIAVAIKDGLDRMLPYGEARPSTKNAMQSASRPLRTAIKNLVPAAKAFLDVPEGDRQARLSLLAAARALLGATHALTVAAADVGSLPCSPGVTDMLLQECVQHTTRLLQAPSNAADQDIHAAALSALTTAERLRYSTAMVAANLVNVTTAQQILKSGEEVESRLSQLSGLIVPLLGGSSDPRQDPHLKEAARMVATEFRTLSRLLKEAPTQPPTPPLSRRDEARLLRESHLHLAALENELTTNASDAQSELLPPVRAAIGHLLGLISEVEAAGESSPSITVSMLATVQGLATEGAQLVAGFNEDSGDEATCRAVHYLRQLVLLAFAGSISRQMGEGALSTQTVPELLHPAMAVAGLVAAMSCFLRQS